MLTKRKQGQHRFSSDDVAACFPSDEDENLQDSRRLRCYPSLSTNGVPGASVGMARRVHWQSDDPAADGKQMSPPTANGIEPDHIRGNSDGVGAGGGGGVRVVSRHRVISVRPCAAISDDDDDDDDDDDEEKEEEEMERQTGFGKASAITPSPRNARRMTLKNTKEFSQVSSQQSGIHSELPLIDLESDPWTESSVKDLRFESENPVENKRTSRLRSDPGKPKSFLADFNSHPDVTAPPVRAFDNSDNSSDLESNSIPLVTVSYLRHDSLAAAGDAARASTVTEISGGTNRNNENATDDVAEQTGDDATWFLPMASDASWVAAAAAATAAGADLDGPEPLRSDSSSSNRSLDRSSSVINDFLTELNLLPGPVCPDESMPFARVGPDEDSTEERGESDGKEATGPGFLHPGSSLMYANEMILTTRPSKVNLLYSPAPPKTRILFHISRDKIGFYRKYYAHLELNGEKIFYLAGRKRVKSRSSSYVISIDRERLLRDCDAYVGKLRSNYMGTKFTLYNTAEASLSCPDDRRSRARSKDLHKEELAAIIYAPNPLGFYGPRRMTVILPGITENDERIPITSQNAEEDSLLARYKARRLKDLIIFHNKAPVWERAKNSYVLNFHGRVTQPSVKNFQLVPPEDHNDIVMQFGRIGDNTFTMDFKRPLSAVQAFGIALSCFDCKLACE